MARENVSLRYNGEQYVDSRRIAFPGGGSVESYVNQENCSLIMLISAEVDPEDSEKTITPDPQYAVQIHPPLTQDRLIMKDSLHIEDGKEYIVRAYIGRKGWADIILLNNGG